MIDRFIAIISRELHVPEGKVRAAVELLDSGATVPFIALSLIHISEPTRPY